MKGLDVEEMVFTIKIINLNAEIFTEKTIVALIFEINGGSIHMKMTLIN